MRAAGVLLAWTALSVAGCGGGGTAPGPAPGDPTVSPAIRAAVGPLRSELWSELRSLPGEGSLTVAVVAGGTLVWAEAFGSDPFGAPARADAAYPLHDFTDLIAAATALHWMSVATDGELRLPDLPPAAEWSCRTLAPLWPEGPTRWPRPAVGLLQRAGAPGVRTTGGCDGWHASAPELARLGAAVSAGVLLGDRHSAWLLEDQAVRTAEAMGRGGAAVLLMDRIANIAVAVMTDRGEAGAAASLRALAGLIHLRVRSQLSPP